jgi:hypothetical protein
MLIAVAMVTWYNVRMWHTLPGQKGSFLDLQTALTSKLNGFPHLQSNQAEVIEKFHQIINRPAKFRGSNP